MEPENQVNPAEARDQVDAVFVVVSSPGWGDQHRAPPSPCKLWVEVARKLQKLFWSALQASVCACGLTERTRTLESQASVLGSLSSLQGPACRLPEQGGAPELPASTTPPEQTSGVPSRLAQSAGTWSCCPVFCVWELLHSACSGHTEPRDWAVWTRLPSCTPPASLAPPHPGPQRPAVARTPGPCHSRVLVTGCSVSGGTPGPRKHLLCSVMGPEEEPGLREPPSILAPIFICSSSSKGRGGHGCVREPRHMLIQDPQGLDLSLGSPGRRVCSPCLSFRSCWRTPWPP